MKALERHGANIQARREARRLTREVLGLLIGRSEDEIAAIERGEMEAGSVTLVKIAAALGTTETALVRGVRWDLRSLRLDIDPPGAPN